MHICVFLSLALFRVSFFFASIFIYVYLVNIFLYLILHFMLIAPHHTGFERKCAWLIPTSLLFSLSFSLALLFFSGRLLFRWKLCLFEQPTIWMNVGNEINAHFYKSCKNVYCRLSIACGFLSRSYSRRLTLSLLTYIARAFRSFALYLSFRISLCSLKVFIFDLFLFFSSFLVFFG